MAEIRKADIQFRAEKTEDNKLKIKGYAAVFNEPETYDYTEIIDSKAFDETDMNDVVLRYNHNDTFIVLARTRNGSLKLSPDEKGLFMEATLQNDISDHVNIYNAIQTQLIDKESFAFSVEEDKYDYDTDTRVITKIRKLYDVSVVDQPFYSGTDVSTARKNEVTDFSERRKRLRKEHEEKQELEKKKQEVLNKLG